jgi:hypothetical protein
MPIWAVCAKFPVWTEQSGVGRSVGAGFILILLVVLIVFRKTVFEFIKEHFNIKHAPPLTIWLVLIVISHLLIYIGEVMKDMTTVFWMGLIGCGIGTFLTYIAESRFGKVKKDE